MDFHVILADRLVGIINTSTTADNTFVKRRKEDDFKRLSVGDSLHSDGLAAENPEKWATRLLPSTSTLSPENLMERVSSGTLNSISDLPFSESDPILSPNTDTSSSLKPSPFGTFDPYSSKEPLSPTPAQMSTSSSLHNKIFESLSLGAHQSRTGSDPSSSDPSRPSSGADLWIPSDDVPIDKMMNTVTLLQTQLTRLMVRFVR